MASSDVIDTLRARGFIAGAHRGVIVDLIQDPRGEQ